MEATTMIRVSVATQERLKELKGDKSVIRFLDELTLNLIGGVPAPLSAIEKRLDAIEKKLNYFKRDESGELVKYEPRPWDAFQLDESGRMVLMVCDKDKSIFTQSDTRTLEQIEKDDKADEFDKDCLIAYFSYYNNLSVEEKSELENRLFPGDIHDDFSLSRIADYSTKRDIMIDFGRKLLEKRDSK